MVEDTKWVIWNRKSNKDRQNNGQNKKEKGTSKDLQNTKQKTRTPLKARSEIRCSRRVSISLLSNMVNSSDQKILLKSYVNSMTSQIWWTIICSNWIWIFWCNFVFNIFLISTWSSKCLGSTNTDEINRNCSMQVKIMNGIFAFICLRPMKQEVLSKLLSYRNLHFW